MRVSPSLFPQPKEFRAIMKPTLQISAAVLTLFMGTLTALGDDHSSGIFSHHWEDSIRANLVQHAHSCFNNPHQNHYSGNTRHGHGDNDNQDSGYNTTPLQCGDVITANTVMVQDLVCPNTTGFAVLIEGNGITLDGNGHKIIAPQAAAGVYIQGSGDTVQNVDVEGVQVYGLFAYDSPGITFINNNTSNNLIGMEIYTDNVVISSPQIIGNTSTGNIAYGMRTGQGNTGQIINPTIRKNDFSNTQGFAIAIEAAQADLGSNLLSNVFTGSQNGIYLTGGSFTAHDFTLVTQLIVNTQIFAVDAASISIQDVDVSTLIPPNSTGSHTGIDFYHVLSFDIDRVSALNNDMGVRLETDHGISPTGAITNCFFGGNHHAGVSIISYDSTPYGQITFKSDFFAEGAGVGNVLLEGNTVANLVDLDGCTTGQGQGRRH